MAPGPAPGPGLSPPPTPLTPTHVRDVGTVSRVPNRGPVLVPTSLDFVVVPGKVRLGCGNWFPGPNHTFSHVYTQKHGFKISVFAKCIMIFVLGKYIFEYAYLHMACVVYSI